MYRLMQEMARTEMSIGKKGFWKMGDGTPTNPPDARNNENRNPGPTSASTTSGGSNTSPGSTTPSPEPPQQSSDQDFYYASAKGLFDGREGRPSGIPFSRETRAPVPNGLFVRVPRGGLKPDTTDFEFYNNIGSPNAPHYVKIPAGQGYFDYLSTRPDITLPYVPPYESQEAFNAYYAQQQARNAQREKEYSEGLNRALQEEDELFAGMNTKRLEDERQQLLANDFPFFDSEQKERAAEYARQQSLDEFNYAAQQEREVEEARIQREREAERERERQLALREFNENAQLEYDLEEDRIRRERDAEREAKERERQLALHEFDENAQLEYDLEEARRQEETRIQRERDAELATAPASDDDKTTDWEKAITYKDDDPYEWTTKRHRVPHNLRWRYNADGQVEYGIPDPANPDNTTPLTEEQLVATIGEERASIENAMKAYSGATGNTFKMSQGDIPEFSYDAAKGMQLTFEQEDGTLETWGPEMIQSVFGQALRGQQIYANDREVAETNFNRGFTDRPMNHTAFFDANGNLQHKFVVHRGALGPVTYLTNVDGNGGLLIRDMHGTRRFLTEADGYHRAPLAYNKGGDTSKAYDTPAGVLYDDGASFVDAFSGKSLKARDLENLAKERPLQKDVKDGPSVTFTMPEAAKIQDPTDLNVVIKPIQGKKNIYTAQLYQGADKTKPFKTPVKLTITNPDQWTGVGYKLDGTASNVRYGDLKLFKVPEAEAKAHRATSLSVEALPSGKGVVTVRCGESNPVTTTAAGNVGSVIKTQLAAGQGTPGYVDNGDGTYSPSACKMGQDGKIVLTKGNGVPLRPYNPAGPVQPIASAEEVPPEDASPEEKQTWFNDTVQSYIMMGIPVGLAVSLVMWMLSGAKSENLLSSLIAGAGGGALLGGLGGYFAGGDTTSAAAGTDNGDRAANAGTGES